MLPALTSLGCALRKPGFKTTTKGESLFVCLFVSITSLDSMNMSSFKCSRGTELIRSCDQEREGLIWKAITERYYRFTSCGI